LLDLENEQHLRQAAFNVKSKAAKTGVRVTLSNPCFEVWTLLHLVDTGEAFVDCKSVTRRFLAAWESEFGHKLDSKTHADYAKIIDRRNVATTRARTRRERDDPSWTEVYELVEHVESLANRENRNRPD